MSYCCCTPQIYCRHCKKAGIPPKDVKPFFRLSDKDDEKFMGESTHPPAPTEHPEQEPVAWRPIESAPKDGTFILLMYMHIDTQIVHNGFWIDVDDTDDENDVGWWSYEYSEVSRIKLDDWMMPTHWMPLPSIKENT